jgi:hypothetical protein
MYIYTCTYIYVHVCVEFGGSLPLCLPKLYSVGSGFSLTLRLPRQRHSFWNWAAASASHCCYVIWAFRSPHRSEAAAVLDRIRKLSPCYATQASPDLMPDLIFNRPQPQPPD